LPCRPGRRSGSKTTRDEDERDEFGSERKKGEEKLGINKEIEKTKMREGMKGKRKEI
jgi:hypothetical protein